MFCGIHLTAISQWVPNLIFCISMNLTTKILELLPKSPRGQRFNSQGLKVHSHPLRNRTPKNLLLPSHTWQICSRRSTIHLPMCEQAYGRAAGIQKICPCLPRNHFAHMWMYLYFLCAYWISVYHFISTYMLDTFVKLFHWISNLACI